MALLQPSNGMANGLRVTTAELFVSCSITRAA